MKTQQLYQIASTFLSGVGKKKVRTLISKLPSIEALFEASIYDLHEISSIPLTLLFQLNRTKALELAKHELEFVFQNDINTHFYLDSDYPRRLKQCPDAPLLIYSKGSFDPNPSKIISIVGTRHSTDYGKELTQELIKGIQSYNVQIVSGLAFGTDYNAHKIAIDHQLSTIGVLGHGLDRIYPHSHKKIAEIMVQNYGGGLITEFSQNTIPDRVNFPRRNRIVAGMSDALVVIESKCKGGSMITAELAFDYNRDVFAFPGSINKQNSSGCNLLIQKNMAQLITESADLINSLNWEKENNVDYSDNFIEENMDILDLSIPENRVISLLLKNGKYHFDQILASIDLKTNELNSLLFNMELLGSIHSHPGKIYSIQGR